MPRSLPPKRKSIDDWGGLEPYLDGTADEHNGLKYKDFLYYIRPRKHPISKATAADEFGISRGWWYELLKRYSQEQTAKDAARHQALPGSEGSAG